MEDNVTFLYVGLMLLGVAAGYLTSFFFMKKDDKGWFYFLGFCVLFAGMIFLAIDRAQFVQNTYANYDAAFKEYKETNCMAPFSGSPVNQSNKLVISGIDD